MVSVGIAGLIVFPAAVLLLAAQRRRREAFAWLLVGGLTLATYFVGYESTAGQRGLALLAADPFLVVSLSLATLGGIGGTFVTSLAIGALVVAVWLALLATGAWRRVPPVIVAATLFFGLSCGVIAVGRAVLGAEGVMLSRYRMYSGLAVLLTFTALAWAINARSRLVEAGAITGAAALYGLAWMATMPSLVDLSMMQTALRDHFAADGRGHYDGYTQEFGDFTLRRARELGVYDGALDAAPAARAVGASPPAGLASNALHAKLYTGERVLSAAGWMSGGHREIVVWLDDGARAFKAGLVSVRYFAGPLDARTAFHGTVSLAGVPAGRYRLGYGGNGAPGVAWTDASVEVGLR